MTPARRDRFAAPRHAGLVALPLGLVLGLGACATARTSVALRGADDLRPAESERYVLPDSAEAEAGRSWGFLSHESLVIYRPEFVGERRARDGRTRYRREVEKVGRGGVAISGYRLADGRYVKYEGTVRLEEGILAFEPRRPRGLEAQTAAPLRLAAADVHSLDVWLPSTGRTVLAISAATILVLAGVALSIAASFERSAV